MKTRKFWMVLLPLALVIGLLFGGCGGSDGSDGKSAYEIAVENGFTGTEEEWLAMLAGGGGAIPGDGSWFGEYCNSCHEQDGLFHQVAYDQLYRDGVVQVQNLAYAYVGTNDVVTFEMTKNGNDFDCTDADSLGIYFIAYDGSAFAMTGGSRMSIQGTVSYMDSTNVCTSTNAASALGDLSKLDGLVVVYGRDETVNRIPGTRVSQARYPFAAVEVLGTVDYVSAANSAGCEKCHTTPYLKHGYIYAETGPGTDFFVCKACHLDNGEGGHFMWQLLVDDARLIITLQEELGEDWEESGDPRLDKYAYKTSIMNDVHMSHAMEFPYPQSMATCATCHDGKLGDVLNQDTFTLETCKSCHPVTDADGESIMDAPALFDAMPSSHATFIDPDTYEDASIGCNSCHTDAGGAPFVSIHAGYDPIIYTDANDGTKISEEITVSIDSVALNGYTLSVAFSAAGTANGGSLDAVNILPGVMVGLYGANTKDYLVGPHERDVDSTRNLEFDIVGSPGGTDWTTDYPRGAVDPSSTPGNWLVTFDLSHWANLIDDGTVWRGEVGVMPELRNPGGDRVAINAVSETFELAGGIVEPLTNIVNVDTGCNNCHDALGTTFHGPDRGGSIEVCRLCHITMNDGSHMEMQSRSIDAYVHGIHAFQPFDFGDIDFSDEVEALHFEHHIGFIYPTLGFDCESCHNPGTYDVPSQTDSMPGWSSPSDANATTTRAINDIPDYISGPAGRACGSCHIVPLINADDATGLDELFSHIEAYGYLWENDEDNVILNFIVDAVLSVYAP